MHASTTKNLADGTLFPQQVFTNARHRLVCSQFTYATQPYYFTKYTLPIYLFYFVYIRF